MKRVYAVIEGSKILMESENKKELEDYIKSFPEEIRKNKILAEKFSSGNQEQSYSHWIFYVG